MMGTVRTKRRAMGEHLTPVQVFKEYILPEIEEVIHDYRWVDFFAGEGNLILPILELVPLDNRVDFFRNHMFLFDIQDELVERAVENAIDYGIPELVARENILKRDTIQNYPTQILDSSLPVFHITNPPYLYIGYIVKHPETRQYLDYFRGKNKGYQDLYQLGLMNDLRNRLENMIYIIPSNFLFGFSGSNKIRDDFLKYYGISKAVILEKEVFEFTGTNVVICFFSRKETPQDEVMSFEGLKINRGVQRKTYYLDPKSHYRAGNEFEDFVKEHRVMKPLGVKHYLEMDEVMGNPGSCEVEVMDANAFTGKGYEKKIIKVNERLANRIKSNRLFVRTVDTGGMDGRAGLYDLRETFGADGILVTKAPYRTHPIQIFFESEISTKDQTLLKDYFNLMLEHFRDKTDSEFLTTYKYSNSEYTRKYMGLTQAKNLIKTFPLFGLNEKDRTRFKESIKNRDIDSVMSLIWGTNSKRRLEEWL